MAVNEGAKRYAQAVFLIATDSGEYDRWSDDLNRLAELSAMPEFASVMANPKVPFADKSALIDKTIAGINQSAINLVHILLNKGRLGLAEAIARAYGELLDNHRGIAPAEVTTAVPLDETEEKDIVEFLSGVLGKKVVLHTRVDTKILGGVIARAEGKLLDGSTRHKLSALRGKLTG